VAGSSQSQLQILTLLVTDASESQVQAALDVLRAQASGDEELAEIEQLRQQALGLHRARADDRRRSRGLTALSDTAADLATHRNVDELLAAICRRARLLLGTDVAYVTLRDETVGDTYVHATDGIVSEAFRTMRLPSGTGLGGLVAQTGQPEATADYSQDHRLRHTGDVDRRVAIEGLRGIVAVPLKRGSEVFGVLLSGSREVRHFEPSEVALFASLGFHAAIALENARLMQDSRQKMEDLARAHGAIKEHAERVEHLGEIYEQLAALALQGGGVRELLEALVTLLPGEIELRGPSGEPLEVKQSDDLGDELSDWLEAPVLAGADELGTLRMRRSGWEGVEPEVLQRTAVLVASILLSQRAQSEAHHRRRSMLLEELLDDRPVGGGELQKRATRAGITVESEHVILVLAPPPSAQRWAWVTATDAARARKAVVGTVAGRIVVIEAGGEPDEVASPWSKCMRAPDGEPPTIGAAAGAIGAEGLRVSHREATRTLNILLALGRTGTWATAAQLGIFGQMLGRSGEGDLRAFLERTLGAVKRHDTSRRTELTPTLSAFLAEGGHIANTARRLKIHVNTLYQRLERLDDVLGEDWRESDRRLELHLAVRLDSLDAEIERGR
jgi:sugar diacid utilization regulator